MYVLRRPDGRPFYVGKGVGDRAFAHENEARHPNDRRSNPHKLNIIRAIWRAGGIVDYEIALVCDDAAEAYEHEVHLIAQWKRVHEGGTLANRAPGGGSTAGPAPESLIRHAATLAGEPDDNPDRAAINRFVLSIAPMRSVVAKPSNQFRARPTQPFPKVGRSLTLRQAAAIAASASANGIVLEGEVTIPRRFYIDGIEALIENGVSCDIVTSDAATLIGATEPADELFRLRPPQTKAIVEMIGLDVSIQLGLV